MPLWSKIALTVAGVLICALWVAIVWQQRAIAELTAAIAASSATGKATKITSDNLDALPPPVARYLKHVLPSHLPMIRLARYRQIGNLRTDVRSSHWMEFEASQIIAPPSTAFLWTAQVKLAPLMHIGVRDSLLAGIGSGQVTLLSAIPMAKSSGGMEMHSGSLHRFLAEAVWYPSALLPGPNLRWTAIDNNKSLATLSNNGVSVSLEFRFNSKDEIIGFYTPGRWGSFEGGYKLVPWEGYFRNYADRGGILVPAEGDVGWYSGSTWQVVWKGSIVDATFEFNR